MPRNFFVSAAFLLAAPLLAVPASAQTTPEQQSGPKVSEQLKDWKAADVEVIGHVL